MELFKLFGSIFIDTDAAEKSMQKVEQAAEDFMTKFGSGIEKAGERIEKFGDKMSSTGKKMTLGVTTPLVALGTKAISTAADFEAAMSEVGAISGATGDDLAALRDKAEEMGKTTKFSVGESAEALKYMAMAGWDTNDMLDGLEGIMNLAAASGEDLGITSDIVTDSLTAFGLSASDSEHFADLLAQASSNANTNVKMMGETFKYVAPVAGALGFSAEDTALAVGLMANSGIKASQAGTSLRASLTNLAKPTDEMVGMMVSLGLATEETATVIDEGKLQKAQTKVENKTIDMQKAQIKYNEAVGKYGASSSQAQTAALNLEKAQNNLEAAINDLNAAQEGEIETTGIQNHLLVDSEGNTKSLREVMLALRDAFSDLSQEEQAQAAATLFGKEAMSGMLAVINASEEDFNSLAAAIDSSDGAAKEMADTMNDNLNGQITLLKSQVEALFIQFVELVMPYLKQGVEWLSAVCDWIAGLDDGTKGLIIRIGLLAAAAGPLLTIFGKGISVIGSIVSVGGKLVSGVGSILKIGSKLSGGISSIIKIGGGLVTGATKLFGLFSTAASFIGTTLIPAIASIGAPVLAVIGVITALVAAGVALYKNWDEICAWAGKAWGAIKDTIGGAIDGVIGFFSDLKEKASEKFHEMAEKVSSKAEELKEKAVSKFEELRDKASEKVASLKEKAVNKFEELKEKASEKVASLKERAVSKFEELRDKASEKVESLKEKAVNKFEELKEKASEKVASLKEKAVSGFEELKAKGLDRFEHLRSGISDKLEKVKGFVSNTVQKLKDFFNFDWKLPKIKLPHFSITGEFSLNPPSIPHIGVEWYKKAMDTPMIMEKPTAFGINRSGQVMAGGEAGSEVVGGTETLMRMISAAVAEENAQVYELLRRISELLATYLPGCSSKQLVLDTGALVGELAGPMDEKLGWKRHMDGRWR